VTPKEIRGKKDEDLNILIDQWRTELALLRVQASVGQCAKPARIGMLKKDVARAKTILTERKSDGNS
jgi:large subunit ribosomal protein L29